jgi:imidazole glycerol-phosphate synthase subunit HisH
LSLIGVLGSPSSNIGSIRNALEELDFRYKLVTYPKDLDKCSHFILPGNGTFSGDLEYIKEKQLFSHINDFVSKGNFVLGICLGMHLLLAVGEEMGTKSGLNMIKGKASRMLDIDNKEMLPNIGWCKISAASQSRLLGNDCKEDFFYFMHSYFSSGVDEKHVTGNFFYGKKRPAVIEKDNIFGVQFHPEKSLLPGLKLIQKFASLR